MSRWVVMCGALTALMIMSNGPTVQAKHRGPTLAVIMTNDKDANEIQVYDTSTHRLLQSLSTRGKGGAAGNARGVRQFNGELFAAVNNGSNSVALFRRDGDRLRFTDLVTTTSAPVSVDFGNDHLYVAGVTTIDSFQLHHDRIGWMDGTVSLELAGGGTPPTGSTAQVGVVNQHEVLVTLKTDPTPGTVDVISLRAGAVIGDPTAVPGPAASLTPFGFSVYPDGSALITLAHSAQDGLFRNGAFVSVVASGGQLGPCWTTRVGKYVFVVNTGSRTISRVLGTGSHLFIDNAVAATVTTGGSPLDVDADGGVLGVIDHGAGVSHLSLYSYNAFGELAASGGPITVNAANGNGVAIMVDRDQDD